MTSGGLRPRARRRRALRPVGALVVGVLLSAQTATAQARVQVEIDGVRGELGRNIRGHLTITDRESSEALLEDRVRQLHARAPAEIRVALQPFGYYRPRIRSELERRGNGWRARYRVEPGEPVRIGVADIRIEGDGASDPALSGVFDRHGIRPDAVLRHDAYERAKQALQNRAAARGYLDASYATARVAVDTVAYTAHVSVHFVTGPRYRFGTVAFAPTPFDAAFLDRFVPFEPGDPFRLADLVLLQRELAASDYFQDVEVDPDRDRADGLTIPVVVRLRSQKRVAYTAGVGWGTDTGPRVTGSVRQRWLNASAHRLEAEARASAIVQAVSARYRVPAGSGPHDGAAATAAFRREAFEDVRSRSAFAGLSIEHGRGRWRETASIRVQREWFRAGGGRGRSTLLLPEIAWSRVDADDLLYPRRGVRVRLALRGTATAVGSDLSFAQASAGVRLARGLHPGGRLLLRLDAAATAVAALADLPVSFRFFAGGQESVRGFDFRALGPVGPDGTVIGGRHLLTASIEFEQRVLGPVGIAVFADAGNAFASVRDARGLARGAGVGARWQSPVGPVQLDLAWPIGRADRRPHLHFAIGGGL